MASQHQTTGTAADLITYNEFHHRTANEDRLTRIATASEKWVITSTSGIIYTIKFDQNFSKKHLFTFSKSHEKTAAKAAEIAQGGGSNDAENWNKAEHKLVQEKMEKVLKNRQLINTCKGCNHTKKKHQTNGGAWAPKCKEVGCICTTFRTSYGVARIYVGKQDAGADANPLFSHSIADTNTCIIMNYIPKSDFELVLIAAISLAESAGWNVSDDKPVKLDFGPSRLGAVRDIKIHNDGSFTGFDIKKQGATVTATKQAETVSTKTFVIKHMGASF
jgi:hypothetical protein